MNAIRRSYAFDNVIYKETVEQNTWNCFYERRQYQPLRKHAWKLNWRWNALQSTDLRCNYIDFYTQLALIPLDEFDH